MNNLSQNKLTKLTALLMLVMSFASCKKEKANIAENEELILTTGSRASWKGYLENGYFNSGTIALDAREILLKGETITGGEISIPVSSILITNDLPADKKAELLHHLQTSDFFNLAVHPFITYKISSAGKMPFEDELDYNYLIKGKMALLGRELALDIPARIAINETSVSIKTTFSVDRTKWGMTYASSGDLGPDQKIKNNIEVTLDLNATRF